MQLKEFIIMEGNTVEEAVNKAVNKLKIKKEQVNIEILSKGKHGFLGVGSQPAKVKVSIKEEVASEMELTDILDDLDIKDESMEYQGLQQTAEKDCGLVEIKEGKVIITNPQNEGSYAKIKPGQNVRVLINGTEINDETPLFEGNEVEIQLLNEEPVSEFELKISEDKVEARLRLVSKPGAKFKLKNQGPVNNLLVLTDVEEILEPPLITPEDVKLYLKENNVVKGIKEEAIKRVIENPNGKQSVSVAEGKRPVDGVDAYIKYPFLEEQEGNEEEGLFGRSKLLSVSKGDVVAIKIPAKEGEDGWAITGETLVAKKAVDQEIHINNGCEIIENGTKAIANTAGRPVLETIGGKSFVSVDLIYQVQAVDHTTGDVKFSGDVEVRCDVHDGFTIEAGGNVEVFGNVTRATIKAGAGVVIHKMILGSTITAGGIKALYVLIIPILTDIKEMLEQLYMVANQLKTLPTSKISDLQAKGDGQLIQLLIESKFKNLPSKIDDLSSAIENSDQSVCEELLNVTNLLNKSFCGLGPLRLGSFEHIQTILKVLEQVINLVGCFISKTDSIKARYVQNSTLHSSGDIIIEGQGCYISSVMAGGEVIVSGNPGIARGAKITANRSVIVAELGSDFDTQTSIKINDAGKISAKLIYPNVTLQVGGEKYRVEQKYREFDAYINHEGRLIINKLKFD